MAKSNKAKKAIHAETEISVTIGDDVRTLTQEEAERLYTALGKALGKSEGLTDITWPFGTPSLPPAIPTWPHIPGTGDPIYPGVQPTICFAQNPGGTTQG